jgi:hypothetical protein
MKRFITIFLSSIFSLNAFALDVFLGERMVNTINGSVEIPGQLIEKCEKYKSPKNFFQCNSVNNKLS